MLLQYLLCFKTYILCRHAFDLAVVYEDLVSDPESAVRALLKGAGITEDLETNVQRGLAALGRDSQNGVFDHSVVSGVSPALESAMTGFYADLELEGLEAECSVEEFRRFVELSICPRTTYCNSS